MTDGSNAGTTSTPCRNALHVHVHGRRRSGAVAALLEIVCGAIFQAFGVGHFYAGNVGLGLFLLLGYWLFLAANIALTFLTCGFWGFAAMVLIPAAWFLLMIVSPILAAASVSEDY